SRMGSLAVGDALRTLRALAERRVLRLPPSDSAVTLCSALADPIVRSDGIWIAGLHAEAWPPPAQLDPFIPPAALRRAGVPAAIPASRLAQAREVLRRCRLAAAHVVASWPMHGADGENLPSPLLAEWGVSLDETAIRRPSDSLAGSIHSRTSAVRGGRRNACCPRGAARSSTKAAVRFAPMRSCGSSASRSKSCGRASGHSIAVGCS